MPNNIDSLSERVPVDETLQALKFVEQEKDKYKLEKYVEDIMPFGDKASIKYRGKFFQSFIECDGNVIIYTPLIKFINNISDYQTKKEVIYFITCIKHKVVAETAKAFTNSRLKDNCPYNEVKVFMKEMMPKMAQSSIDKTCSTVISILKDFNLVIPDKNKIVKLNLGYKPTNEAVLFCLYYEFIKIKENKLPDAESFMDADTFKFFWLPENLIKRYVKWMIEEDYIGYYVMGDNSQYQFNYNTLDQLVEKVTEC